MKLWVFLYCIYCAALFFNFTAHFEHFGQMKQAKEA